MPVFQHTPSHQPERMFLIGYFGRWLIRCGNDIRLAIFFSIKPKLFTFFDIGVITFTISPECFFTIDYRPTDATCFMIGIKFCLFMAFFRSFMLEAAVFFKQTFLYIKVKMLRFMILVFITFFISYFLFWKFIG